MNYFSKHFLMHLISFSSDKRESKCSNRKINSLCKCTTVWHVCKRLVSRRRQFTCILLHLKLSRELYSSYSIFILFLEPSLYYDNWLYYSRFPYRLNMFDRVSFTTYSISAEAFVFRSRCRKRKTVVPSEARKRDCLLQLGTGDN